MYARSLDDYDNLIGDIGNEAIKEFAERLKGMPSIQNCEYEWVYTDIDSLVEEMCGKDEGK